MLGIVIVHPIPSGFSDRLNWAFYEKLLPLFGINGGEWWEKGGLEQGLELEVVVI